MAFITSTTQPISGTLGDEWFNPNTNRIYKLVPLNGTNVTWREYNLPSLKPTPFIPVYSAGPVGITQMLVVAGGGGGSQQGGGGGAGGLLYYGSTVSPSKAPNGSRLSLGTSANIVVIIGAGGAGGESSAPGQGVNGSNTTVNIFSPFSPSVSILANSFTAVGGGAGGIFGGPAPFNLNGGSGGGGGSNGPGIGFAFPGQGNNGGSGSWRGQNGDGLGGGGGGGAGQVGKSPAGPAPTPNGAYQNYGGAGVPYDITGSNVWYAGGGGGGGVPPYNEGGGEGGRGGGGGGIYSQADGSGGGYATGRYANATNILAGTYKTWGPGARNLGGGGGGGIGTTAIPLYPALSTSYYGGSGGSGVVIIRANTSTATYSANVSVSSVGGETVYTFNGSGVLSLTGTQLPINLPVSTPVTTSSPVVYPTSPYYLPPAASSGPGLLPNTTSVNYLVVGGGGGSGYNAGSGGGAGGALYGAASVVLGTPYAITIGGGGTGAISSDPSRGSTGTPTTLIGGVLSFTALGGGGGGSGGIGGLPGGSGAGSPGPDAVPNTIGAGSGFPGTAGTTQQGYPGGAGLGTGASRSAGGGGGAGQAGQSGTAGSIGGKGGDGYLWPITGTYYAGGGGSGVHYGPGGAGGAGGGGAGGPSLPALAGSVGWTNRGGGAGGGAGGGGGSATGGSGVVLIAHPTAFANAAVTGSNVLVSNITGNIVYSFYSPGTITI